MANTLVPTRASRWLTGTAVLAAVTAAAQLVAWGNRWYVAEMFARSATDSAQWRYVYERLHVAHGTLLTAVVLTALSAGLLLLSRRLRRGTTTP